MDRATLILAPPPASQLPPEILLNIFEDIQHQHTFRNLRLVSRQFDQLITPIWCREVVLTPDIVAQYTLNKGWADHTILQVQMTVHTRHVIIKTELDWVLVNRMLSTLRNLTSLLWIEWPSTNARDLQSLLAFQEIREGLPHLEYQVEAFRAIAWRVTRLRDHPDPRYYDLYFAMRRQYSGRYPYSHNLGYTYLPTAQLTSLKFTEWDQFSYQYVSPLLLGNDQLKTLHIAGKYNGTMIEENDIGDQDSLPPVEELSLQNYDWDYSPPIINSFWNWSKLTVLELRRVPILHFLYTVPAENLAQLQVFRTDGFCLDNTDWDQATRSLSDLISKIRHLQEVSLTCNVGDHRIILSLLGHGVTLNALELRSYHDPFATHLAERVSQKRVSRAQLCHIRATCPHLTTLALDYNPLANGLDGLDLTEWDYALTGFRNLRRLRINAWTFYRVEQGCNEPIMAIHYRNARGWNQRLALTKLGAKLESIVLRTEVWDIQADDQTEGVPDAKFGAEVTVVYGDL